MVHSFLVAGLYLKGDLSDHKHQGLWAQMVQTESTTCALTLSELIHKLPSGQIHEILADLIA
jgi:hypothetical protein